MALVPEYTDCHAKGQSSKCSAVMVGAWKMLFTLRNLDLASYAIMCQHDTHVRVCIALFSWLCR